MAQIARLLKRQTGIAVVVQILYLAARLSELEGSVDGQFR
jgi:hypothetical protein